MTNEEIEKQAKERAEKLEEEQTLGVYDNDEDLARDRAWNEGEVSGYERGYIDGAKWVMEHAIEWHDLRKNPNDLPKESGYYWCRTEYDDKFWKYRPCLFTKTDGIFTVDVIAWCELPTYGE